MWKKGYKNTSKSPFRKGGLREIREIKENQIIKATGELDIGQLVKHLDLIDERLDNIDSIVTTLVERVMEKPLIMEITCPKCGQPIEINITSSIKMRGKG